MTTTTLAHALSASDQSITLVDPEDLTSGQLLALDAEYCRVLKALTATQALVQRGVNGTPSAPHLVGVTVSIDVPEGFLTGPQMLPAFGIDTNVLTGLGPSDAATFQPATGGGGTPSAPDTSVQFNDSGSFGGSADFTWDGTHAFVGGSQLITFTDLASPPPGTALGSDALPFDDLITNHIKIITTAGPGTYTLANSGIVMVNGAGDEVFRIWGTDPDNANKNSGNIYIGHQAGFSQPTDNVTAGYQNVGIGEFALYSITTGINNYAMGQSALYDTTSGSENVAIGAGALEAVTEGLANVAIGYSSAPNVVTSSFNSAIGIFSLYFATTGESNTALGAGALSKLVDGDNNTAVGAISDIDGPGFPPIVHGDNNTLIGFDAGPNGDYSNTLALGAGAQPLASNHAVVGNASVTDVYFGAESGAAIAHASDYIWTGTKTANFVLAGPTTGAAAAPAFRALVSADLPAGVGTVTSIATTSPISGGTITGTGTISLLVNTNFNWTVGQTITSANDTTGLTIAGGSITGSGTTPFVSLTGTWNTSGVATAVLVNINNTASATTAALMDLQLSGASKFKFRRNGTGHAIDIGGNTASFSVTSGGSAAIVNGTVSVTDSASGGLGIFSSYPLQWASDTFIYRGGAAATVQLGADVNGAAVNQIFQSANGITGTDKTGGNLALNSGKGTGAGAVSAITLGTPTALGSGTTAQSITTRLTVDVNGIKATGYLSSDGSAGVTAGPFTTITSITVKNGLVTALTGA